MARSEDIYVKRIYQRIVTLGLVTHGSYIFIYAFLHIYALAAYNVFSVFFYCVMLAVVGKGAYRVAVSVIHVEVCLFVLVSVLAGGWDAWTSLYLIAMASLVYFCPYRHRYVPYLFSLMEMAVFLVLRIYTAAAHTGHVPLSSTAELWLNVYNACAAFGIVLYGAFNARVSAAVSQRILEDENKNLADLANYDQLTGLLSRHAFQERFAQRGADQAVLAMGDIDDFKLINDTFGHACGDDILSAAAELMRRQLSGDVDICRWGGEEFVFLFRDTTLQDAVGEMEGLRRRIKEHLFLCEEGPVYITMTFGVGPIVSGNGLQDAVKQADEYVYIGKAQGKDRVVAAKEEE